MKIAIRADGSLDIGMGHIMRTLVLAKELAKSNEVFYICRTDNTSVTLSNKYRKGIEKVKGDGFQVKLIRESHVIDDLKKICSDILITDSYDVNEEYFDETKKMFRKTMYIDDMNLLFFNVDFLVNQNINAEDFNYRTNENTRLMLGTKYIMLREEFRTAEPKIISENIQHIMLTVGGGDPYCITEKILDYAVTLEYILHVVVGPSFENIDKLERFQNNRVRLYHNADMYDIMQKCDIAISACGSTLYELCACGVPTLGVIVANNQEKIGNKLDKLGIIKNLGWHDKLFKNEFIKYLENICENYETRRYMSDKGRSIIDGRGVQRIVHELMKRG